MSKDHYQTYFEKHYKEPEYFEDLHCKRVEKQLDDELKNAFRAGRTTTNIVIPEKEHTVQCAINRMRKLANKNLEISYKPMTCEDYGMEYTCYDVSMTFYPQN